MNIVLIGMPGSGKSKIGFTVARKMYRRFIDTDNLIFEIYGDVSALFSKIGEQAFREKEKEAVKKAVTFKNCVISTGGGTPTVSENMNILKSNSVVVFLDASAETIMKRTVNRPRPVLSGGIDRINELLAKRRAIYSKYADLIVCADDQNCDIKAQEIIDFYYKVANDKNK